MISDKELQKKNKILGLMKDENYIPIKIKEMAFLLGVSQEKLKNFNDIINNLISEGDIILTKKGKLILPEKLNLFKGTFYSNSKGFGFVTRENSNDKDIFIPSNYTNGAMDKDTVFVKINLNVPNKKQEGEVVSIINRRKNFIVGTFEKSKGFGFVRADDNKIYHDIFISKANCKDAITGHKVVVKIIKPAHNNFKPEGKVIEILGHINDPGVDILSIIKQYELPLDFPQEVYKQIENIKSTVEEKDFKNRTDLRSLQMVTIDGEDAKDLDDAISLEVLDNGNYRLGVHIADVAHYVTEGSPLDKEALKRGTSVYLVDRVIPMLPHKLSNGICSLNPNVDRLALSCIMDINSNGNVVSHKILETVININKRMSYVEVSSVLKGEDSPFYEGYKEFLPMLKRMGFLSKLLRERRVKRGAIDFAFPESKIILDEQGKPLDVILYKRSFATSIIEEFMLVANETIAEEYFWLEIPFVFRSHTEPDSEKIEKLSKFISYFGYSFKGSATHPKNIQNLLSNLENTKEETIISRLVLRSLKQARYSPKNEGHFGLAAQYYCHFTSPIRRYPDLQIHRIIKENLSGEIVPKRIEYYQNILNEVCKICSITERTAEEAERETDNYKKVEYMCDKVGNTFEAIISGVTSWGIYVELSNTIEGMIAVSNMDDDYYIFDDERFMFVGERFKKVYALGDKVSVKLIRANTEIRKLDFIFA